MKKQLLVLLLTLLPMIAMADKSGSCGDNVTWTYTESTKTLTIQGSGTMDDYSDSSTTPWEFFRTSIQSIVIEDGVTSLGGNAFSGCSRLTSVTIPNSVTISGDYAFKYCSSLTSITIPNSVTSIGSGAFYSCSGLTSITIPNSVTSIGEEAFYGTAWFNNQPDGLVYAGKVVYKYKGEMPSNTSIIIKDGTLGIGDGAFSGCYRLTSITIPNSVTSIGEVAFWHCSGLTSITIPNSVTSIGWTAFGGCSGLTSITIPNSVTSIGNLAFRGCSGLTSVTIPNSVTSIGSDAFYGCSGLTSIMVDNGNIKYDSRNNCNAIIETATNTLIQGCKNTIIPNSVTSIGSRAFWGCSGLTSITIPNSVTSIGSRVFWDCSGLTSITIPNSVTSIGFMAFYGCYGLQSVYSKIENVFAIIGDTFPIDTYRNAKLYVPIGKKSAYQETEGWKEFYNIEEYDYSTGIAAPQMGKDAIIVDAYQLNGQKRNGMQRGLNIVRMSDGTTKKVVNK